MSIDLASLTDPTPPDFTQSIPLNVDPFPYDDLSAQGRYPVQSTPDTYPPFVGLVSGIKAENPSQGRAGMIDSQHRLLVHDPASSGGGGLAPAVMTDHFVFASPTPHSPQYDIATIGPLGNTLYGWSVTLHFLEPLSMTFGDGSFRLYVKNFTTLVEVGLCFGAVGGTLAPGSTPDDSFNESVMLATPRDITAINAGHPNDVDLWIEGVENAITLGVYVFTS